MTPEEFAREFEKAPKNLMKSKANEILFAEDYPEGRMQFVCKAMNDECASLKSDIQKLLEQPEGARHLVRALNNLTEIGHHGSLCFAQAVYDSLENDWDSETKLLKFIQILDSVSASLRTGLGWLSEKSAQILDSGHLNNECRVKIWMHWCMAVLRSNSDASPLIEELAPRRPLNLSKTIANALLNAFKSDEFAWDHRSAAAFLLLGNQLISLSCAQAFVDDAYACFPLEALEGVEILAIAVENDASSLAEFDVIQAKLAQIRQENLYLRDMPIDEFQNASLNVFQNLKNLPKTALEMALSLPDSEKNDRLIKSAFIDDARRADWIYVAHKNGRLKQLSGVFFKKIDMENPLCISFCSDLMTALLDHFNADAVKADDWFEHAKNNDISALQADILYWIAFCEV